ncbi:protein obstructor-E-like [Epargyreus clarus]|uniref:protein obstructor-E-like n=1 Tax=Epargyreus clarus TaxID=520877 RepID=UPI003C2FB89D
MFISGNGQSVIEINGMCETRNGYYDADNSCDAYYECRDYQPTRMLCPDGLNYNPNATWPSYPCSYPADVPCYGRSPSQPPKATAECPRQFGFFPSPLAAGDCGQYRLCAEGRAYDMTCPYGLGFDIQTGRCDWPENVPGCNVEGFLGFTCPAPEYDREGNALVSNYKREGDCYMFFSCQSGRARLLSCDPGYAFDPVSSMCVNADLVDCESFEGDYTEEDITPFTTTEPNEETDTEETDTEETNTEEQQ